MEEKESSNAEKDEKIESLEKDVKWEKANAEKTATRLERQVESFKNKVNTLTEDKKSKAEVIKDLNNKIKEGEVAVKDLEKANAKLQKEVEGRSVTCSIFPDCFFVKIIDLSEGDPIIRSLLSVS